jgi:protein pelota
MKILSNKIENRTSSGSVVLIPTSADDLYMLSSVIAEDNTVEAHTTRKLSLDGGHTQQKITVKLMVKAETLAFDLDDGIMSIKGKVCKENEYIEQGVYHTIHVSLGEKFELWKARWTRRDTRLLSESTKDIPHIAFIVFYDRDCAVSSVTPNNIRNTFKGEIKAKNFRPVLSAVAGLKDNIKMLVIASFSAIGEEFYRALSKENKALGASATAIKLTPEYKNIPNAKVISRILVDKQFAKSFKEVAYVNDLQEIEDFFLSVMLGSKKICVGLAEIQEAFEYGAIKVLFVTDALYRPRTVEERRAIEAVVAQATELRARICIIPVIHESGERLRAWAASPGCCSLHINNGACGAGMDPFIVLICLGWVLAPGPFLQRFRIAQEW